MILCGIDYIYPMDIIKFIEEVLPVESPFYVKEVLRDESQEEIHIHVEIERNYRPNSDCSKIHQYYERTWEHTKLFQYRCFLHCRLPVYYNKRTQKTEALRVDFSRSQSRFTLQYEQEVLRLLRLYHSPTKVAQQLGVKAQRIEKIYHDYTTISYHHHQIKVCEQVGVDETSTKKGHHYITIFVDMETHQILDIEDGRSSETIETFFEHHPNPEAIREISADMSPAFAKGFKQCLPWAKVTFDKWHVLKLLSKHLETLRKKHRSKAHYIDYLWNLLQQFYKSKELNQAKALLYFMKEFAHDCFGKNTFSKSVENHYQGITEHIRSKLNNGLLEGINSKIQTIKRVAKGFRYTENLKKMILFVFGVIQPRPHRII